MCRMNYLGLFSKPTVIVFIGNVGAGKTTCIYTLRRILNKYGNVVYSTTLKKIFALAKLAVF